MLENCRPLPRSAEVEERGCDILKSILHDNIERKRLLESLRKEVMACFVGGL